MVALLMDRTATDPHRLFFVAAQSWLSFNHHR
jgi:hypothetical protein